MATAPTARRSSVANAYRSSPRCRASYCHPCTGGEVYGHHGNTSRGRRHGGSLVLLSTKGRNRPPATLLTWPSGSSVRSILVNHSVTLQGRTCSLAPYVMVSLLLALITTVKD